MLNDERTFRFLTMNPDMFGIRYQAAEPFPHIVIDNAVEDLTLRSALLHWPSRDSGLWRQFSCGKSATVAREIPEPLLALLDLMNTTRVVGWLARLTGISGLHADRNLAGAGLHEVEPSGFLKMHVDFNRLRTSFRRLNVLLYVNRDWQDEWRGHLDLRGDPNDPVLLRDGGTRKLIAPQFNRLVISESSERSWHGHPDPLACPPDVCRRSLAWYFFTPEPGPGYAADHSTIYADRSRPDEQISEAERTRRKQGKKPKRRKGKT